MAQDKLIEYSYKLYKEEWQTFFIEGKLYEFIFSHGFAMDFPRDKLAPRMFIGFKEEGSDGKLIFLADNRIEKHSILVYLRPQELYRRLL